MHQVQLRRRHLMVHAWGPADRITLFRAVLAGVVALLAVVSFAQDVPAWPVVALASVGLVLDGVDGFVARRTGTVTPFGARFDLEVDAFLLLALSGYVAPRVGWWVLPIGLARYLFVAAGWAWPWLRGEAPPRPWCKVVAVVQGVVLTVAASSLLPHGLTVLTLLVAMGLLAESFGREAWELGRQRDGRVVSGVRRPLTSTALSVLALLLVWVALLVPASMTPSAFLRVPAELVVLGVLALVLPSRATRVVAVCAGVLVALLVMLSVLDAGFRSAFARPFHPVYDAGYAVSAVHLVEDSFGRWTGRLAVAVAVLGVLALLVALPRAMLRLARDVTAARGGSTRLVAVLATVWLVATLAGSGLASGHATELATGRLTQVRADLADQRDFEQALADDPAATHPPRLAALRGKDVLVVFVESYGRTALAPADGGSDPVAEALTTGDRDLRAAGWSMASGYLTSPTYGGLSWLAHSTLQSGVRVHNEQRYDSLLGSSRLTLARAFHGAGWRTVDVVPSNREPWPEGQRFYGYDRVYAGDDLGYAGPEFGYASMPDQYTLAALRRLELGPGHSPVMAEVDLVSSHTPWAPLPRMVPWGSVRDGAVFDPMPGQGRSATQVWRNPAAVRAAYDRSIAYSLRALTSFLVRSADDDLVVLMLGDHQPSSVVSGNDADHGVPVSILSTDPTVVDRVHDWGWEPRLRPSDEAPVWPMESLRDRFLSAYETANE